MNTVYKIIVSGLVQGIGFRPFVAELAEELHLAGQVKNLGGIVKIIVSGDKKAVDMFVQRLGSAGENGELPGARIDALEIEEMDSETWDFLESDERFYIVESEQIDNKFCFLLNKWDVYAMVYAMVTIA